MNKKINIENRKARFEYERLEEFTAGIQLLGTEIKSIRLGKASLAEAYCYEHKGEIFIKNMHIAEYDFGNINNHEPTRERKLLLQKREIDKIIKALKDQGVTLIPMRMFLNDRGLAKLQIALARGKKLHDKRDSLREKDMKRDIDRATRNF